MNKQVWKSSCWPHIQKWGVLIFLFTWFCVVYWRNILCLPAINPAAAARDMQLLNPEEWSEFLQQLLLKHAPTFISVTHTSRAFLLNRISQRRLEKSSSSDYVEPRLARTTSMFPNAVSDGAFTPKAKKNFMLDKRFCKTSSRTGCVFITYREASYFCDVSIKQQSSCLAKTPQAKIRFFCYYFAISTSLWTAALIFSSKCVEEKNTNIYFIL